MPTEQIFLPQHSKKFLQCWIRLLFIKIMNSTPNSLRIEDIKDNTSHASCVSINWGLKCSSRTRSLHCYTTFNSMYAISSGLSSFLQQFSGNTYLGLPMLLLEIAVEAKNDVLGCTVQYISLRHGYTTLSLSTSRQNGGMLHHVQLATCKFHQPQICTN